MKPLQRLICAVYGILAGDAALWLLILALFRGSERFFIALLYTVFALGGWIVVGLPIVLLAPPRLLCRLPWPFTLVIGAVLGPLALFLIFVLMYLIQVAQGYHQAPFSMANTQGLLEMSAFVSTVAFGVYVLLVRRRSNAIRRAP